jgi:hypothetical protein
MLTNLAKAAGYSMTSRSQTPGGQTLAGQVSAGVPQVQDLFTITLHSHIWSRVRRYTSGTVTEFPMPLRSQTPGGQTLAGHVSAGVPQVQDSL